MSVIIGMYSTLRVSEYLTVKSEPLLKTAKDISQKLAIDPVIVLGF
jgi:HTH-type transcriptional regulator/antitoxin HigA